MMKRQDMTVVEPTEPFINLYYNGPERRSDRNLHEDTASRPWRLRSIVKLMLQKTLTPYVFSKNMGYYLSGRMRAKSTDDLLRKGVNTFIIRDPFAALPSHYKQDDNFNKEEAGYAKLRHLFEVVTQEIGQRPIVVDGDEFCSDSEAMMKKYCMAVGIPFDAESMHWESGQVKAFDGYAGWTDVAEKSTGFQKPPDELPSLSEFPPWVGQMAEKCRKHYEYLLKFAIQGDSERAAKNPRSDAPGVQTAATSVSVRAS